VLADSQKLEKISSPKSRLPRIASSRVSGASDQLPLFLSASCYRERAGWVLSKNEEKK